MKEKRGTISLPATVLSRIGVSPGDRVMVTVDGNRQPELRVRPLRSDESRLAPLYYLIPAVLCALFFLGYFGGYRHIYQVPLAGQWSIASGTILLGIISGTLVFGWTYLRRRHEIQQWLGKGLYWRSIITIMASFIMLLGIGLVAAFWLAATFFRGLHFGVGTATFIVFLVTAVVNYLMIRAAAGIAPAVIFRLLVLVLFAGASLSIVSNSDKRWWQYNISFLGSNRASDSWQFNITLVVVALLMVCLFDYLFSALQSKLGFRWRTVVLHCLLTAFALFLGAIGIFANNGGVMHALHIRVAADAIYTLLLAIVLIHVLLPESPRNFQLLSYGLGVGLFGTAFLFQGIHYLSLTAFEIIEFLMVLGWLLLFFQVLEDLISDTNDVYVVTIQPAHHRDDAGWDD